MVRIPFRSRIPLEVWIFAGFFAVISAISSLAGAHDASVGLAFAHVVE
jgi:hypothetical protein